MPHSLPELHSSRIGPNRPEKGNQERSTSTIINTGRTLASSKISVYMLDQVTRGSRQIKPEKLPILDLEISVDMKQILFRDTEQRFPLTMEGTFSTVHGHNMLTVFGYIHHHLLGKEIICKTASCQSMLSWSVSEIQQALGIDKHNLRKIHSCSKSIAHISI